MKPTQVDLGPCRRGPGAAELESPWTPLVAKRLFSGRSDCSTKIHSMDECHLIY